MPIDAHTKATRNSKCCGPRADLRTYLQSISVDQRIAEFVVLVCILACALCTTQATAQVGCTSLPCTNPVPVTDVTGTWTNTTETWTVTSNGTTVSGSVTVPAPVQGCAAVTWSVSGNTYPSQQTDNTQG